MATKQSYYRYLPDENQNEKKTLKDKNRESKKLSDYPKDIQDISNDIVKYKFQKMLESKKNSKALSILFKILIKYEKKSKQ